MPARRDPSLVPLSHDHHHGLVRVFEIRQAMRGGGDLNGELRRTRDFVRDELAPHFVAEEEVVVPALRAATAEAEAGLARLADEHRRLRELAAALDDSAERLAAFADLLESHIRFEERELFPVYQQHVDAAARLAVEAEVRRILDRPDDSPRTCKLPGAGG
jgi:hemerythrin-like domain-containing protein